MSNAAICRVSDETVLDRVEVNVIEMNDKVPVIADRMLPIAALPDAALATERHHRGTRFDSGQRFGKRDLDRAPTARKVGIALLQGPQAMHVVRKDDPGIDMKRRAGSDPPNRDAQRVDVPDQQVRAAVQQVYREEKGATRSPIGTISPACTEYAPPWGTAECAPAFPPYGPTGLPRQLTSDARHHTIQQ
jgi:hypothetical protein